MLQCRERYSYHVDVASVVRTLLLATRDACAFGTMADLLEERGLRLTAEPRWTFAARPRGFAAADRLLSYFVEHCNGMIAADGEGFYSRAAPTELIVPLI